MSEGDLNHLPSFDGLGPAGGLKGLEAGRQADERIPREVIGREDVEHEIASHEAMAESFACGDELEADLLEFFNVAANRTTVSSANVEQAVDVMGLAPRVALFEVERGDHQSTDQHPV